MNAIIHHFSPNSDFYELWSPGTLKSGERFFILTLHESKASGGASIDTWTGTDYGKGRRAAEEDAALDGVRLVDRICA